MPVQAVEPSGTVVRMVGACEVMLWGLTPLERFRRAFARAGLRDCEADIGAEPTAGRVVLVRADHVFDEPVLKALVATPDVVLMTRRVGARRMFPVAANVEARYARLVARYMRGGGSQPKLSGVRLLQPPELASSFNVALRKREPPYVLSLGDTPLREVEKRMFAGSYKGVTDFVTKYLWPAPARFVTRWAAAVGLSPNLVTSVSLLLVFLAMWLFVEGQFAVGVAAAWAMTFLDTVDGKLARVTLTSTKLGNTFDHGIDLIHPPFWYWAWWYGLQQSGAALPYLDEALWVIVIGYVVGRLMEGFFIRYFKLDMHSWRRVDSVFRLFTARRNPNMAILTIATILGRPDVGFIAVALWTVLSLAFHAVRMVQALWTRPRGGPLTSWLSDPAASSA